MARAILISQTAESAIEVEAEEEEQLTHATVQSEAPSMRAAQQDWGATPRDQSSQNTAPTDVPTPPVGITQSTKSSQEANSPFSQQPRQLKE